MNPAYGGGAGQAGQGIGQHSRFLDLLEQMRNEYSTLENENGRLMSIRQDFLRKVEENIGELQQMEQALQELDRKHQAMKDVYETEISRLKGVPTSQDPNAQGGPEPQGVPSSLPDPSGGQPNPGNPNSANVNNPDAQGGVDASTQRSLDPDASTSGGGPGANKRLPLPSASHGFGGPGPTPGGGPGGPGGGGPGGPGVGSAPLMGIASLPSATHTGGLPAVGGAGNGPPSRLMSGGPEVTNNGGVPSLMKKDHGGGSMPAQGPGPMQPNLSGGTPAGMTASAQQSGEEQDYVVYPGRDASGATVDMKVSLQSSFSHDSVVCCVRYSWNGEFLATGSNKSAQIFDVQSGSRVAVFTKDDGGAEMDDGTGNDSYVRAVCFSPDGNWLITGAEDHVVKVWDVRNRTVKYKLCGHDTDIYSVDASADSRFIISGSGDKKAKLWTLDSGKLLSTLGGEFGPTDGITSVSVSPTSQHVAAGSLDKIVRVWDVESSRLVRQFEGHRDSVYSVAFSPDGRLLLSGSLDKTLKLWDLAAASPSQQCRLSFSGHKDFVLSVAFSPNGQWLISGSKDRSVQFWDARQPTMCLMLSGHKNSVISIAHNPVTTSLATGSGDCRARLWNCQY